MKPRKIEVDWFDHHERHGQGAALTDTELKPMAWRTRGYLVSENDNLIEVVRDIPLDNDVTDFGASMRILKKLIIKRSDRKGG
jgi:hypothetical protein